MNKKFAIIEISKHPDIELVSSHDTIKDAEMAMSLMQLRHQKLELTSIYYWIIVPLYTTLNNV